MFCEFTSGFPHKLDSCLEDRKCGWVQHQDALAGSGDIENGDQFGSKNYRMIY